MIPKYRKDDKVISLSFPMRLGLTYANRMCKRVKRRSKL